MKPLEKLTGALRGNEPHIDGLTLKPYVLASETMKIVTALNKAIDRINELEAKYENHYHEYESYAERAATSEPLQFAGDEEPK